MARMVRLGLLHSVGCLALIVLGCSGGAGSDSVDASNSSDATTSDAQHGLDAGDDAAIECAAAASQCTDTGGYQVCGPDESGLKSFGQRIPCQGSNTCSSGTCGSTCVSPEVLILLDRSSSIADKWPWVTEELNSFIGAEQEFIRFGLRQFPSETSTCSASSIVSLALNNAGAVAAALVDPTVDAQTPIIAAMTDTASAFGDPNEGQYIIVITDGDETCSTDSLPVLASGLARQGIDTFVIGIGNGANPATVNAVATAGRTGPTGYSADNAVAFAAALQDIAQRMRSCVCDPSMTSCVADEFRDCAADGLSFSPQPCADDGDVCTVDTCDPVSGCNVLDTSLACDDGDACTNGDSCATGSCAGTHFACWRSISAAGEPSGRTSAAYVWTGDELIVWGGSLGGGAYADSGALYSPGTDSWTQVSTTIGAPSPRANASVVWTGTEMIVWGGLDASGGPTVILADGGRYSPSSDTWSPLSTANAPPGAANAGAVWTGTEMIVWGGFDGVGNAASGARYDPGTNSWTALPATNAPAAANQPTAIWTGTEMIVWGGSGSGSSATNSGGRFSPALNSWAPVSTTNAPEGRRLHTAIWTGDKMLIWGGIDASTNSLATGGFYDPVADAWVSTPTIGAPSARDHHTAVWTGSEMVIWGGGSNTGVKNDGGEFDPALGTWTPSASANAPVAREEHAAVWTGAEMLIWGGYSGTGIYFSTGGAYEPN